MENNFNLSNENFSLETEFITEVVTNYREQQLSFINENLGIEDAHSIQFDLKTLKDFISKIEEQAANEDPGIQPEELGIRFYYAAYSEDSSFPIPENYQKRHTLVLVPTIVRGDEICDFNPYEGHKSFSIVPQALAQNHGLLVPPATKNIEFY